MIHSSSFTNARLSNISFSQNKERLIKLALEHDNSLSNILTPEEIGQFRELALDGYSIDEIAHELAFAPSEGFDSYL